MKKILLIIISIVLIFITILLIIQNREGLSNFRLFPLASTEDESQIITYDIKNRIGQLLQAVITVETNKGIKSVTNSEGITVNANGKKKLAMDYKLEYNKDYVFKIVTMDGTEYTKSIIIENDDYSILDYAILTSRGIYNCVSNKNGELLYNPVNPNNNRAVGYEAYDGNSTSQWKQNIQNDWVDFYMDVDSTAIGHTLLLNLQQLSAAYGIVRVYCLNSSGNTIGNHYTYTSSGSFKIPDGTVKLKFSIQINFAIREISIQ